MFALKNYFGSPKSQSTPAFENLAPSTPDKVAAKPEQVSEEDSSDSSSSVQDSLASSTSSASHIEPSTIPLPVSEPQSPASAVASATPALVDSPPKAVTESAERPAPRARRFSFRKFSFQQSHPGHDDKPIISAADERKREEAVQAALHKRLHKPMSSRSDKRAQESALALRAVIIGPSRPAAASPKLSGIVAKPQMSKIKSQLMDPKSANRIIVKLRELPANDEDTGGSTDPAVRKRLTGPIHAVCLPHPEEQMDEQHFKKFHNTALQVEEASTASASPFEAQNAAQDTMSQLTSMFNDLQVVDLITAPDLGIGQPGDGKGLLAGSLPTPETVINGIKQITPELMTLGFAMGKAIFPDHTGIYPPLDRLSVFTYWWGLELAMPPPTLTYLSNVESVSNAIVNFLSALALVHNGVREIVPFVRYIAQFVDFEYNVIKKVDQGQGVVCAATWIMPAAMVPRPWDFEAPPASKPSEKTLPSTDTTPNRTMPLPQLSLGPPLEVTEEVPEPHATLRSPHTVVDAPGAPPGVST
ncbi:hypothetical protein DL96DRAFT_1603315 [Flagelloscypha sp. PMI_526]|nr:hypothetical protein DL96DRAFT_1603315 [Flagelloscypha sp. PMI_526]